MRADMREEGSMIVDELVDSTVITSNIDTVTAFVRHMNRVITKIGAQGVFAELSYPFYHFLPYFWRKFTSHLIEVFVKKDIHNDSR